MAEDQNVEEFYTKAKAAYLEGIRQCKSFRKEYFDKEHQRLCLEAQSYLLGKVNDLKTAGSTIARLRGELDAFRKDVQAEESSPPEVEKAKACYFETMKKVIFIEESAIKIKSYHELSRNKAYAYVIEACDDVDTATKYLKKITEATQSFIEATGVNLEVQETTERKSASA